MKYRKIGNSDLNVSEIALGGDTFGVTVDEKKTATIIDCALDAGINYIDTADVYGRNNSEIFIGKALKGKRSRVMLATKFGILVGKAPAPFETANGLGSRDYIMKAVEASLKRLGTDYIDLYQFHMPDPATRIDETLKALDDLVKQGKVRYIGCSNFTSWELCEALWVSKTAGISPFISIQSKYSLLDREIEDEIVTCCQAYNIGVIPWFPLAGGFLTGKYRRGQKPAAGTRFAVNPAFYTDTLSDINFDLLDKLEAFASQHGHSVAELAFAWLLAHPWLSTVIAGVTRTEQVLSNVAAAEWKLTEDEMKQLDRSVGFKPYDFRPVTTRQYGPPSGYL